MAIDKTPVLKRCRALGLDPLFLGVTKKSKKKPVISRKKVSEYGLQLKEKQKAKFLYGVLEKQFRLYYNKATKMSGITGENLLCLLECRLDNVIFRLGYGRTRTEARQVVGHDHVAVNGKKVNIPSYRVKPGDRIEIRTKSAELDRFKLILDNTSSRAVPEWLDADHSNLAGTIVSLPQRTQIDAPINETLIVELYSK